MTFTGFTGTNLPALLDDFNRADTVTIATGGPAAWREGSDDAGTGCSLVSNQIAPSVAGLQAAFYDGIESNHIGFAFKIATFSATTYSLAGCAVTADAGNGVNPIEFYFVAANSIEVWYDNATLKNTMSLSASFASGDQIGFDCEDTGANNVYKVFRRAASAGNWTQVGSYTDVGSGRSGPWDPGFGFYDVTTARVDDFYAEAITAGGAPATPQMLLTGAGA